MLDVQGIREGRRCGEIFPTMYDGNVKCMSHHMSGGNGPRNAKQVQVAESGNIKSPPRSPTGILPNGGVSAGSRPTGPAAGRQFQQPCTLISVVTLTPLSLIDRQATASLYSDP